MSSILDYLSPADLIRAARSSKLLREMAYDDTRWVQKLKRMGCWNESEARKHIEETFGTIASVESVEQQQVAEQIGQPFSEQGPAISLNTISDGFDQIKLSTFVPSEEVHELEKDPVLGA